MLPLIRPYTADLVLLRLLPVELGRFWLQLRSLLTCQPSQAGILQNLSRRLFIVSGTRRSWR